MNTSGCRARSGIRWGPRHTGNPGSVTSVRSGAAASSSSGRTSSSSRGERHLQRLPHLVQHLPRGPRSSAGRSRARAASAQRRPAASSAIRSLLGRCRGGGDRAGPRVDGVGPMSGRHSRRIRHRETTQATIRARGAAHATADAYGALGTDYDRWCRSVTEDIALRRPRDRSSGLGWAGHRIGPRRRARHCRSAGGGHRPIAGHARPGLGASAPHDATFGWCVPTCETCPTSAGSPW
jgi:hypothetical protein